MIGNSRRSLLGLLCSSCDSIQGFYPTSHGMFLKQKPQTRELEPSHMLLTRGDPPMPRETTTVAATARCPTPPSTHVIIRGGSENYNNVTNPVLDLDLPRKPRNIDHVTTSIRSPIAATPSLLRQPPKTSQERWPLRRCRQK